MEKSLKQQPSNCIKIVLFGPESTGKTTLARQLAAYYKTQWVPEYMREYLQEKWTLQRELVTKEDLIPIAKGQITQENFLSTRAEKFLFCDTNLLEIKVYSEYYYGGCPPIIKEAALNNHYDFYFLTFTDVPWEADDLRDRPQERAELFAIFEAELIKNNLPFQILKGTKTQRLTQAINSLSFFKK